MKAFRFTALMLGMTLVIGGAALTSTSSAESQGSVTTNPPILDAWIINTEGRRNPHWPNAPVDVQSVQQVTVNGVPYAQVRTNGIADYYVTLTSDLIQELNSRPRAQTDFRNGQTTASVGQTVRFGDDIGYRYQSCFLGWWPPGPGCPTAQNRTFNFPMQPIRATQPVSTTLGAIGLWINGTAVYNWSDAQSYQNGRVWMNTALSFEKYDMDICPGHAAMGDYHHHSNPDCIGIMLNDNGSGHSPIYGFAADGFPIYGPWESANTLAQSGWQPRNYDDPTSITGCGVARVRNCLLRNPLDPSQGTVPAPQTGPRTDSTLTTMSGNVISGTSGVYFQDYWFDRSCGACLDEHNGHDMNDGRGYHYHVTVRRPTSGSRLVPAFPYIIGPTFAGQLNPSVTPTPSPVSTAPMPTAIRTATATRPPATLTTAQPTSTAGRTPTTVPTAGACGISFSDVPSTNTFYQQVMCLSCMGFVSGYADGTFRPNNTVTRGQLSKIVANAAGFSETPTQQTFEDVPTDSTFYAYIERMAARGVIGGYRCGGPGEPCREGNRPYFRPGADATRGQISKIVANAAGLQDNVSTQTFEDVPPTHTFYTWIERLARHGMMGGYACGGPGELCGAENRPYFRAGNNATRGQVAKIVGNGFYPNCSAQGTRGEPPGAALLILCAIFSIRCRSCVWA